MIRPFVAWVLVPAVLLAPSGAERIDVERSLRMADAYALPRTRDGGPMLEGPGQLTAAFTEVGAEVGLGEHRLTLVAARIGRHGLGSAMRALRASTRPEIVGAEVRTGRGDGVVEWWRSPGGGLEHGLRIAERPAGDGALVVELAVGGDLRAHAASLDGVDLLDPDGSRVASYAHLVAIDAAGARLPARMAVRDGRVLLCVDDSAARYPLDIDPLLVATEEAALVASSGAPGDLFGIAVALSAAGDRALVGATGADFAAGSARVFHRTVTGWSEEAALVAAGGAAGDRFGGSVALSLDGSRAVVGASGADAAGRTDVGSARVFLRTGTSWAEEATLVSSDGATDDQFGRSVALSADGSRALVGVSGDDTAAGVSAGSARVFLRSGASWAEEATLLTSDATFSDALGSAVALSGDGSRALVGATGDRIASGAATGSARVFMRSGTTWREEATLLGAGGAAGDGFGGSVALSADGSGALVGAASVDTAGGTNSGSAFVFIRSGTSWTPEATLAAADGSADDRFGRPTALSADGSRALIGVAADDTAGGVDAGSARLFLRTGTGWAEESTLLSPDGMLGDGFGVSLALAADGSRALVGAWLDDTTRGDNSGSARVFVLTPADPDGVACAGGASCLSGFCVDGVCCRSDCGGGAADDCQGCSSVLTGGPSGVCAALSPLVAPTVTCRVVSGVCDVADVCSPLSMACVDLFEPPLTPCRPITSVCDAAETCTGSSAACPPDGAAAAGTGCRPSSGACDAPEACDGASRACPGNRRVPAGIVCRASAGTCDAEEACDGLSPGCPIDSFRAASVVCRPPAGPCDVEDRCGGLSSACGDARAIGVACRAPVGACDLAETCDGIGVECPIDDFLAAGTVCAPQGGDVCDAPDLCTGSSAGCPPRFLGGVECRARSGACDTPEVCAGSSPSCPPDTLEPAGIVCRSSVDLSCDPTESCDGVAAACPADVTSCGPLDAGPSRDAAAADAGPADDGGASPIDAAGAETDADVAVAASRGCACRAGGVVARARGARPVGAAVLALLLASLVGAGRRARAPRRTARRTYARALARFLVVALGIASCGPAGEASPERRSGSMLGEWAPLEMPGPGLAAVGSRGARILVGGADVELSTVAIGRIGSMRALGSSEHPVTSGAEVRIDRGGGVVEWWRSDPRGLEQGVAIAARPGGQGELVLEVDVRGDLEARALSPDAIDLVSSAGAPALRYAHLVVLDGRGARLPARMAVRAGHIEIVVDDGGAHYPLIVDPLVVATEEPPLPVASALPDDNVGTAVALSSDVDRALVGVPQPNTADGHVRVFRRAGANWVQESVLRPPASADGSEFGSAVALSADGSRAIVGAHREVTATGPSAGTARVFVRSDTTWAEEATLVASDAAASDRFGAVVALSTDGSRALVAAPLDDTARGTDAGSVTVFLRAGSSWVEEARLVAADGAASDFFGGSIALSADGTLAVIGMPLDDTPDGPDAGSARIYLRTGTSWAEDTTLAAADGAVSDMFGVSVALSADGARALVGAYGDDTEGGTNAGSVRVFVRTGVTWTETAALRASGGSAGDLFGVAVALTADGSQALVGASADDNVGGIPSGTARVFVATGTSWTEEVALLSPRAIAGEGFGEALALAADGALALVAAPYADTATGPDVGSVSVFTLRPADPDGVACASAASCLSGFCVDGVCCQSACGGGAADDCRGCAAALTAGPSGLCTALSAAVAITVTCRTATDACDVADTCSPASTACIDRFATAATVCRPVRSGCDAAAEVCTGTSSACPADAAALDGTVCRASSGSCDVAEACDGASFACPADTRLPAGVVCRGVRGPCDSEERCDGASTACPLDAFLAAAVVCGPAIGPCDVEDRCDGASSACTNVFAVGTTCRPAIGPCDVADTCEGTGVTCPPDVLSPAGAVCDPSERDVCDVPDVCTGSTASCAPMYLSGVECRAGSGACDRAEACTGFGPACPPDTVVAAGIVCRASTDLSCDATESCDGAGTGCPADVTTCPAIDAGAPADGGGREAGPGTDADVPARDGGRAGIDAGGSSADVGCTCRVGRRTRPRPAMLTLVLGVLLCAGIRAPRRRSPARAARGDVMRDVPRAPLPPLRSGT